MQLLFQLFIMFAQLASSAFGGGYVVISSLITESESRGWATAAELTNTIALAGMTPGPVAMNIAVAYGYKLAGFSGAAAALLGIAFPCAVIVIIVAKFFLTVYNHPLVKGALYGLRATVTGIIIYGAINIAVKNGIIAATSKTLINKGINISAAGVNLFDLKSIIIAVAAFLILTKTKLHPVFLIIGSGVVGVIVF